MTCACTAFVTFIYNSWSVPASGGSINLHPRWSSHFGLKYEVFLCLFRAEVRYETISKVTIIDTDARTCKRVPQSETRRLQNFALLTDTCMCAVNTCALDALHMYQQCAKSQVHWMTCAHDLYVCSFELLQICSLPTLFFVLMCIVSHVVMITCTAINLRALQAVWRDTWI